MGRWADDKESWRRRGCPNRVKDPSEVEKYFRFQNRMRRVIFWGWGVALALGALFLILTLI